MEEFLMSSVYPPSGASPANLCLRCGTPLPSNTVTCANCGTYNPAVQPGTFTDQKHIQWGGSYPQAALNGGQNSDRSMGQPFVPPPQYNQWGLSSTLPQNNAQGPSYTPQSAPPANSFYPMPGQNPQS